MRNRSEANLEFERTGPVGLAKASVPACSTQVFKLGTNQPKEAIALAYRVTNFLVAPGEGLRVTWTIPGGE